MPSLFSQAFKRCYLYLFPFLFCDGSRTLKHFPRRIWETVNSVNKLFCSYGFLLSPQRFGFLSSKLFLTIKNNTCWLPRPNEFKFFYSLVVAITRTCNPCKLLTNGIHQNFIFIFSISVLPLDSIFLGHPVH